MDGRAVRVARTDGTRDAEAADAADDPRRRLDRRGGATRCTAPLRLLPRDRRSGARPALPGGVPPRRLRFRVREPPARTGLRARERGSRARLDAHRPARALRRADLRRVADARPALAGARRGARRGRAAEERRLPRRHARRARRPRRGDRAGALPPADGRASTRARLGEPRALREEGPAAAPPVGVMIPYDAIDTLFLDAGNTLVSMDFALLCDVLAAHGVVCEPAALARAEAAARPAVSRFCVGDASGEWSDVFTFYLHRVLGALGGAAATARDALAPTLASTIRRTVPTPRLWSAVLPGVPDALARLRAAGITLVLVSNSDGTAEHGLAAVGLRTHVHHVVDSAL